MKDGTRERCGAKTQSGPPCRGRPVHPGGRCKFHGGCSTGPKSPAGKAVVALNLPRVRAAVLLRLASVQPATIA